MNNNSQKVNIIVGFFGSLLASIAVTFFFVLRIKEYFTEKAVQYVKKEYVEVMQNQVILKTVVLAIIIFLVMWFVFSIVLYLFVKSKQQIEKLAYQDQLTGFANATSFEEEYNEIMQDEENHENHALVMIDVNNMKMYVDKFGITKGNEVLAKIGIAIHENLKEYDIFARMHSNEFAILMEYYNQNEIVEFIEKVSASIKEVTISSGITIIDNKKTSFHVYQDKAISALIDARKAHNGFTFYREASQFEVKKEIEQSMKQALKDNEFKMYLQPKYDLKAKKFCSAEALVRWNKADGRTIQPKDFISIFEENGFIIEMDLAIFKQACQKIREWIQLGYKPLPISINVSQKHMLNQSFVTSILKTLAEYQIPNELIELDITETCISVTVDKLVEMSESFYGQEFFISMDRYDDRDSAITMLEDVSADTIKLNKAFFSNALDNPKVYDAIKNIVYAFKKRNIAVVAEGIETKEQVEMLEKMKCQIAQGYYFSKPLSVQEFDQLIYGNRK